MPNDTSSFFGRGVLLFFTILTNNFLASFEGVQLWDQRPVVEKHFQYGFYRPSAEAIASMLCDLPNKLLLTASFNIPFYFLANMRRTPAAFFTFYLFAFASLLTGSMLYRTIGALSRTLTGSIAPRADFILMLVIYTRFVLPIPSMHPWFGWFGYIDPVGSAFESLMINEFSGRQFTCNNGQAILCTIHQPSGILFEMFDRLIFLKDGRSIYFGDTGLNSRTPINYFHKHGARGCGTEENPAEWLLDITGCAQNTINPVDWPEIWQNSQERHSVRDHLKKMKEELLRSVAGVRETSSSGEYASSFAYQLFRVTQRNLEHDWRTPSFLYSKIFLTIGAGLFNGFSFYQSENSIQGVQNQIFSVFLLFTLHSSFVQLIMPQFLENRALYELHERPSRTYSWVVFILSNIIAELPWQTVLAVIQFITWYYPLGMYRNALVTDQLAQRGALMFLIIWSYMTFSSTFSQMVVSVMPDAATGVNISALLYSLSLILCGVLVSPSALPRFWIFMYRVTPVTYFINALVSTGLSGAEVICAPNESLRFEPAGGQNCGPYMQDYINTVGGRLLNPSATQQCQFCPVSDTDSLLATLWIKYEDRWRNFAITLVYSGVNVIGALCVYWLARIPKGARRRNP